MTPELKQRIQKEAKDHCDLQIGDKAKFPYKDPIHVLWQNEFDGYVAGYTAAIEKAEKLREALERIATSCTNIEHAEEIANKALEQFKKETE